ncbi:SusC/RagA family TonB-linked outer membrane protein [Bacteroidales bacterium OttesenSCG-928-A17]|nr:SusC/RagA family TonB-linked outer membrane protein [Bacteroidales bacterium OttesenSCG-928-A17]
MRLTFYLIFFCSLSVSANVLSQATVSISLKNSTLHDLIWELERQTDFSFVYNTSDVENVKIGNLKAEGQPVDKVLDKAMANSGLTYEYENEVIVIRPEKAETKVQQQTPKLIAKGVVTDEDGEPLTGVSVLVVGNTSLGTVTDFNGNYSLEGIQNGETLQFRFIGMKTVTVVFNGEPLNITLVEDDVMMEEVIVIAYGEQKRSAFTGSAAVVSSDIISRRPVTNVMSAIEGLAPGVQVQTSSGAPDATPSFRVRGVSSISAGKSPLIILDGAPYESGWNNINPNDVESMTVLKDAASTAIYGARGGNGVILITTKKAGGVAKGKIAVTLDTKLALTKVRKSDLYETIDTAGEHYERHYDAMYNFYTSDGKSSYEANRLANASFTKLADEGGLGYVVYTVPDGQMLVGSNGKLNPNATLGKYVTGADGKTYYMKPDSWFDETFRTGLFQEYNLTVRGATEKISLIVSGGYTNNEGITSSSGYERFTGRMKGTMNVNKWFRLNANLDVAKSITDDDQTSNSNSTFSNANRVAPIYPVYVRDENKNIVQDQNGNVYDYGILGEYFGIERPINPGSNRLQEVQIQTKRTESTKVGAQAAADFMITEDLTATVNVAYADRERRYKSTSQPFYGTSTPGGNVSIYSYKTETVNLQQLLNYGKRFGEHNVKATLLHEFYTYKYFYLMSSKSNMFNYFENQELAGAITLNNGNSYLNQYQSEGYGGRALYDYKGIYMLDASYRRDASTRFHPDHRWGNFYSFGGAYILSKEDYFNVSWVDDLKFKFSFGQNGNDDIGEHLYVTTYDIVDANGDIGTPFRYPGNNKITWETRTAINTGFEFELFKGRLQGSVEYYNIKTTDMLASVAVPYTFGYSSTYDNVGDMRNSGFEFDLRGDIIRAGDFRWNMYVNASFNKNRILKLAPTRVVETLYNTSGKAVAEGYSSGSSFMGEGLEFRTWFLKKFAGTNENGQALWYVLDKETGELSTTTTYATGSYFESGSSQPKVLGGFGGSFSWKSLELFYNFAYRLGGYGYDSSYASLMAPPYQKHTGYAFHVDTRKSWTPENQSNEFARWQYDDYHFTNTSDRWLTKADYLSLQNITLSYRLPKNIVKEASIDGITASVSMDNIFFLSKRKGYVPTQSFDGNSHDLSSYPGSSKYMLTLKFDF